MIYLICWPIIAYALPTMPRRERIAAHRQKIFSRYSDIQNEFLHFIHNLRSYDYYKIPDYYPNGFPPYPGVSLKDLKPDDVITVRVFFRIKSGKNFRVDGGYIDLEVEAVEENILWGVILTELPDSFPLAAGTSMELHEEEVLYKIDPTEQ